MYTLRRIANGASNPSTFYLDRKRGDVGGQGFEDIGVWHAAVKRAA